MPKPPTPPQALAAGAVRVVLFGMPAAGKSSLLGSLSQASKSQESLLHAHLTEKGNGLEELRRRVYEDRPQETLEEVVAYPVRVETLADPKNQAPVEAYEAVLFDCDGRVANEFLTKQKSLDGPTGDLAGAVLAADTLILVVDAADDPGHLEKDFALFGEFLRLFQTSRGKRSEVAGLPVYLVLSKCDLLASRGDSPAQWMEKIEERKRQVGQKFREFLAGSSTREQPPFGTIDLQVWATAVKRPPLADRPARPEPYGVAELFRQALASARRFSGHRLQVTQRLHLTALVVLLLVSFLALLAAAFFLTRPSSELLALENKVRSSLPAPGISAGERLRDPENRLKQIHLILKDPTFEKLPDFTRAEVERHGQELEAYLAYNKAFIEKVPAPRFVTREEDLQKIEKTLTELPLPKDFSGWEDTKAGKRRQQVLQEIKALRETATLVEEWFQEQARLGNKLYDEGVLILRMNPAPQTRDQWLTRVGEFLEQPLPFKESNQLPNQPTLTYGSVYNLDRVIRSRMESWERSKSNLEDLSRLVRRKK